jgi:hypothetical protein
MSAAIILAIRLGELYGQNTRDDDEADDAGESAAVPSSKGE